MGIVKVWEEIYQKEGRVFTRVHPDMQELLTLLKEKRVKRVLDLGCGTGRHTLLLAKNRFQVYGIDISLEGVNNTRQTLNKVGLKANVSVGNIYKKLPYPDSFFDAIISIQTLHHSTTKEIKKLIGEIERILSSNGCIFITVPSKMNQAKKFKKIEGGTFMPLNGKEKNLPHHYFTREEIRRMFSNFIINKIYIDDVNHYAFFGIKKKE